MRAPDIVNTDMEGPLWSPQDSTSPHAVCLAPRPLVIPDITASKVSLASVQKLHSMSAPHMLSIDYSNCQQVKSYKHWTKLSLEKWSRYCPFQEMNQSGKLKKPYYHELLICGSLEVGGTEGLCYFLVLMSPNCTLGSSLPCSSWGDLLTKWVSAYLQEPFQCCMLRFFLLKKFRKH